MHIFANPALPCTIDCFAQQNVAMTLVCFSEWLQEFVNDQDVKIVVISSIGAFHRQLALKGSMPLNLPSGLSDNILDGLFTSGLRLHSPSFQIIFILIFFS